MMDIAQRLRDTLYSGTSLNRIPLCIEAADTIEAQAERIRVLREAMERIAAYKDYSVVGCLERIQMATEALEATK